MAELRYMKLLPFFTPTPTHPSFTFLPMILTYIENWRSVLQNQTARFEPEFVGVDLTGWYVVFPETDNGRDQLQRCRNELEGVRKGPTIHWSQPAPVHPPPNNTRPREDAGEDERPSKRLKTDPTPPLLNPATESLPTLEEEDLTDASMEISDDETADVLTPVTLPPLDPAPESLLTREEADLIDARMDMCVDETVDAEVLITVTLPPLDLAPTWNIWGWETRQLLAL